MTCSRRYTLAAAFVAAASLQARPAGDDRPDIILFILREAGYHTIHCGKAHWGAQDTPGERPEHFGFEVNIAGHAAGGPATSHVWGNTGPGIDNNCAIHQGDWKLIYYYKTGRKELFDIRNDIGERHDLSAERPDLVRRLSRKLGRKLRSMKAQRPFYKATGQPCPWPDE